jgi:two-component system CheB/CheR fusion protein
MAQQSLYNMPATGVTQALRIAEELKTQREIIAIGASAGGLESLIQLFSKVATGDGKIWLIAQHMANEEHTRLSAKIIGDSCKRLVLIAQDGMSLDYQGIYIVPGGKNGVIENVKLRLTDKDVNQIYVPSVDLLFSSMAHCLAEKACGIILSGMGRDGTLGAREILHHKGRVFVQDPKEAAFTGMPQSAASVPGCTGILSISDIVRQITNLMKNALPEYPVYRESIDESYDSELYPKIIRILNTFGAMDFSLYKEHTLVRQIQKRQKQLGIHSTAEYISMLEKSQEEALLLEKTFFISLSTFYRDPDSFTDPAGQ